MKKETKIFWASFGADGLKAGELTEIPKTFSELESDIFDKLSESTKQCEIRIKHGDGSGHLARYEKRGKTWVRTFADNIVPDWFPWFFLGLIVLMFIILAIFMR